MFEYNIVQLVHRFDYFNNESICRFNDTLKILYSEGWQKHTEPTLNEDHTRLTIILKREINTTNGPYR